MNNNRDDFGVGVALSDDTLEAVHEIAVERSFERTVTMADIYRLALDMEIKEQELAAAEKELEDSKPHKPRKLRLIKVRGDRRYNQLLLIIAKRRGLTAGQLVVKALKRHFGKDITRLNALRIKHKQNQLKGNGYAYQGKTD